jgi:predicted glycoside hydrolase/deacetylase ChbG (UPF0249 family)
VIRIITCFFILSTLIIKVNAQTPLAEKMGYTPEDKLLIIHADDIGLSHSENQATILGMKIGMVNSGSIMMPCPWVEEIAEYARLNPKADLGLHLTLTSEWKHYRWGPVAPLDQVPSLVDSLGFLYSDCMIFGQKAKPVEVEIELRAQIEKAIKMGINPTHLDTHMGCLVFNSAELFEIYLRLGREYKIPVMVDRFFIQAVPQAFKDKVTSEDVIIEHVYTASIPDYEAGMKNYYRKTLNELGAGINIILIHLAFNDAEMQGVSIDHPHWGAHWRQADFDFFTSKECQELLEKNNIQLVTWKAIQEAVY